MSVVASNVMAKRVILSAPLVLRLKHLACITNDDQVALQRAVTLTRTLNPNSKVRCLEKHASGVRLIQQGYACRCIVLQDGRRQIVQLLLPGDICDLRGSADLNLEHELVALTSTIYSEIKRTALAPLVDRHPRFGEALWRAARLNEASLHQRIVSLAQRSATESLAHLLCEVFVRSQAVGLASGAQCRLPIRQRDVADVLGLSLVHVNRSVEVLRTAGLLHLDVDRLTVIDFAGLQKTAGFDSRYLQFNRDDHHAALSISHPSPGTDLAA